MIICSCNRLSDKSILDCCQNAVSPVRVRDVYVRLGCLPQCGRCAPTVAGLLREASCCRGNAFAAEIASGAHDGLQPATIADRRSNAEYAAQSEIAA